MQQKGGGRNFNFTENPTKQGLMGRPHVKEKKEERKHVCEKHLNSC